MSGKFDEQTVSVYYDMVRQISAEYRRKYQMVEKEDIEQELWVWFGTHTRKLSEWQDEHENKKDIDNLVAKSLRNHAYDYCFKEKARVEGYHPDDVFFYKKEFIKMLLPSVITDDWSRLSSSLQHNGSLPKSPAESGDWMAYSADIKYALDKLSDKDRHLVEEFYGREVGSAELHDSLLPEKSTARAAAMQANRALNKMVRELGGFSPMKDREKDEQGEN